MSKDGSKTQRFLRHISTDYDNNTFDTGRSLVILVILSMVFMNVWDVVVHKAAFNAQSFGAGAGALLIGLGAYLFGDNSKRPDAPVPADPQQVDDAPVPAPAPVVAPPVTSKISKSSKGQNG
jgi:hypothetical protein